MADNTTKSRPGRSTIWLRQPFAAAARNRWNMTWLRQEKDPGSDKAQCERRAVGGTWPAHVMCS